MSTMTTGDVMDHQETVMTVAVYKPEESFQWTSELVAILLESCFLDDKQTVIRYTEGPLKHLKVLTTYVLFCSRVFEGNPPDNFTIDVYENKMREMNPWCGL